MISLKRTNQGGSVLTFIIIATVLAAAVIGTAFFVKQRGEQVRQQQATAQADKLAKETDAKKTNTANSQKPGATNGASKSGSETPSAKPTPVSATPTSTQPSTPVSTDQAASLPTTGPELDIVQIVAIGLLAASSTAYMASRRTLGHTL